MCNAIHHLDMLSESIWHQSDTVVHAVISALTKLRQEDCFEFKTQLGYMVPSYLGLQERFYFKKKRHHIKHKKQHRKLEGGDKGPEGEVFKDYT